MTLDQKVFVGYKIWEYIALFKHVHVDRFSIVGVANACIRVPIIALDARSFRPDHDAGLPLLPDFMDFPESHSHVHLHM